MVLAQPEMSRKSSVEKVKILDIIFKNLSCKYARNGALLIIGRFIQPFHDLASIGDRPLHAAQQVRINLLRRANAPLAEEFPQDAFQDLVVRFLDLGREQRVEA